jgi:hypothetical protein
MLEAQDNLLPKTGGGSRAGAGRVMGLTSGGKFMLRSAGGRSESGQAADTTDVLGLDEVDDWPSIRVIKLIERRLSKSRDPLFLAVSTLKRDELQGEHESIILRLHQQGTAGRVAWPCLHCGSVHVWEWEHVDRDKQCLVCPSCGETVTESNRIDALPYAIRKDKNETHKISIAWTTLDSPFSLLVDGQKLPVVKALCIEYTAAEEAAAKGDHGLMRQFWRDRFCRQYRADLEQDEGFTAVPTRGRLAALSKASSIIIDVNHKMENGDSWHWIHVPAWVEFASLGVDVQEGGDRAPPRLYWVLYGRGATRGCIVGWGTTVLCEAGRQATKAELHQGLDRLAQTIVDGCNVPITWRGVDTGNQTDELLAWLRPKRDWHAVKGCGPLSPQYGDRAGWVYIRDQAEKFYRLRLIENRSVLRVVHGEILQGCSDGGLWLPQDLDRNKAIVRHICASVEYQPDKWSTKPQDRKYHPEWQRRNDYADALVYARAGAYEWETRPITVAEPKQEKPPTTFVDVSYIDNNSNWITG